MHGAERPVKHETADGKVRTSIPKAIDFLLFSLTASNLSGNRTEVADTGQVYRDLVRIDSYVRMHAKTFSATNDDNVNFPWSSKI